jgi:hypothetical protein
VENRPKVDFGKIKMPCEAEFLAEPHKGIWERCLVHGFYTRGSSVTPGVSLEIFWAITDQFGFNKEIHGWTNVRFTIHHITP